MKRIYLLACCIVMSGCMHAAPIEKRVEPNKESPAPAVKQERTPLSQFNVENVVIKGKTTKDEILANFGMPNSINPNQRRRYIETPKNNVANIPIMDYAAEFWLYWTPPPLDQLKKTNRGMLFRVTFYFDNKGVVLDYMIEDSKIILPD